MEGNVQFRSGMCVLLTLVAVNLSLLPPGAAATENPPGLEALPAMAPAPKTDPEMRLEYLLSVKAAETALTDAQKLITDTEETVKAIDKLAEAAKTGKLDDAVPKRVTDMAGLVSAIPIPNGDPSKKTAAPATAPRTPRIAVMAAHLKDNRERLRNAFRDANTIKKPDDELKDALKRYQKLDGDLTTWEGTAGKAAESLKGALTEPTSEPVQGFAKVVFTSLQTLADMADVPDTITLQSNLSRDLPQVPEAVRLRRTLKPAQKSLGDALARVGHALTGESTAKLTESDNRLKGILAKIQGTPAARGWLAQLQDAAFEKLKKTRQELARLVNDTSPVHIDVAAAEIEAHKLKEDADKILTAGQALLAQLPIDKFVEATLGVTPEIGLVTNALNELQSHAIRLGVALDVFKQANLVDISQWVSDQVSLYYFDDVPRLMKVLVEKPTEVGGESDLRKNADSARVTLNEKQEAAAEARQKLEGAKYALQIKREQHREALRTAKDELRAAQEQSNEHGARTLDVTRHQTIAQAEYNTAQRNLTTLSSNPASDPAKVAAATERQEKADLELIRANADAALVQGEAAATGQRLTDAKSAVNAIETGEAGLAAKVATAERDLGTAEGGLTSALTASILAAQADNLAFARARDGAPFFTSLPDLTAGPHTDPVKRVMLYGFPDSKMIFVRGRSADVEQVKQLIRSFDRPQPQAMLTVWTLEINSEDSINGWKKAAQAMKQVEDQLDETRDHSNRVVDALRRAINAKVGEARLEYFQNNPDPEFPNTSGRLELLSTTTKGVLPLPPPNSTLDYVSDNLSAAAFYDEDVLRRLGWSDKFVSKRTNVSFLKAALPDPYNTTTLAEALVVLALAKTRYYEEIFDTFTKDPNVQRAVLANPDASSSTDKKLTPEQKVRKAFPNLEAFLIGSSIARFRVEMVAALRSNANEFIIEYVHYWANQANTLNAEFKSKYSDYIKQAMVTRNEIKKIAFEKYQQDWRNLKPAELWLAADREVQADTDLGQEIAVKNADLLMLDTKAGEYKTAAYNFKDRLHPAMDWLYRADQPGAVVDRAFQLALETKIAQIAGLTDVQLLASAKDARGSRRAVISNTRRAALNEMLKKYLQAVDDDIQRAIIRPSFEKLRDTLLTAKISVGQLQRTSVLASNRLVARVDPKGSAQVTVSEEQNVLQELAPLIKFATGGAAQVASAGAVGALSGGLGSLGTGSLLGASGRGNSDTALNALSALDSMPKNAPPAVYGISTGNVFQVSPVFDPTGQALRFRFDYVAATQIREPNGTTDPQFPRIERHGVNTEVQLSNQELRSISRFDSNLRLGSPNRRSGGVPILKDIPLIREIPLLGWFVRRGGRAAVVQQSVILAQTSMFPTVDDVIDLFARPIVPESTGDPLTLISTPGASGWIYTDHAATDQAPKKADQDEAEPVKPQNSETAPQ